MQNHLPTEQRFALMQLADSFFPSGSFTLSHGLESLVQTQQIKSINDLRDFFSLLLYNKVGSSDLVALCHAYRAIASDNCVAIQDIDRQLFAQTLLQPTRESQCKSGRALLMVASSTWEHSRLNLLRSYIENGDMHGLHPVVFAVVGKVAGLDEENTVFAFLHSFLTSLCGASIRLGKLGHINAQVILKEMGPALNKVASIATLSSMDDIWSCTPFIDIAQLAHPSLPQKLFSN